MAYFTRQQLGSRIDEPTLIRLSNNNPNAKTVDESVVAEITNTVEAIIDGALRGRYTLPLDSQDSDMTDIAIVLARYKLHERRQYLGMPESLMQNYDKAMARLREYQTGKRILDTGTAETLPAFIVVKSRAQRLTKEILDLYVG